MLLARSALEPQTSFCLGCAQLLASSQHLKRRGPVCVAMVKYSFFQALTTDAAGYHEFSQTPLLNCCTVITEGSFNLILV